MKKKLPKKMQSKQYISKVPTGIQGLDALLEGGIPENRTTLFVGSAGTGKTVLGCQFIWEGIQQFGDNCVFVTFEENKERIYKNIQGFGWDLQKLEKEGRLVIVEFAKSIVSSDMSSGEYDLTPMLERVKLAIKKVGAKRVCIDSLSALFEQIGKKTPVRKLLLDIAENLNDMGVTTLLTAERYEEYGSLSAFKSEAFVSDCVVILRQILEVEKVRRTIQVLKYRGSRHKQGEYPFTIAEEGLVIMPLAGMTLESKSGNVRISSGVTELDKMSGGGFFKDSIILVSGPTGTGKTLLSTTFSHAAAAKKQKVIYFAFEESKDQLFRNGLSWGIDLKAMEKQGLLRIICQYPETAGPEDHLLNMKKEMQDFKPNRIICDSLSAMERVISVRSFREFVISLSTFLKKNEIAAFFTNTTATLLGGDSITETHISTLTDSILLLRYVETGGQMRRGLTVIKMRGSWHDKNIREFEITNNGMTIQAPFRHIESIMTGAAHTIFQHEKEKFEEMFEQAH